MNFLGMDTDTPPTVTLKNMLGYFNRLENKLLGMKRLLV
jgi:hypothetical protein